MFCYVSCGFSFSAKIVVKTDSWKTPHFVVARIELVRGQGVDLKDVFCVQYILKSGGYEC